MLNAGMYVGSHGYDHHWFSKLSKQSQTNDIDLSIDFMRPLRHAQTEGLTYCIVLIWRFFFKKFATGRLKSGESIPIKISGF